MMLENVKILIAEKGEFLAMHIPQLQFEVTGVHDQNLAPSIGEIDIQ